MTETESKIRQYLLLNLPEKESEEIDLQVISDENFAEELTCAEDDLMEDFLDKELSKSEIELFHRNFLVSDERKEQLKQISLLRNYAQRKTKDDLTEKNSQGFFDKLSRLFAPKYRPIMAFSAVLIVFLSGSLIWKIAFNQPENETVRLNKQDLSNLEEFKNLTNLSVFPGKTRGGDDENSLQIEKLTENILLRLAIPPDLSDTKNFNAKIIGNQNETILLKEIRTYDNKNGKEIRLLIPKSTLKKGENKIEVLPDNNDKYPLSYIFKIVSEPPA